MTDARLVIRNLNKSYAAPVLRDVNLSIACREIHAIVGENGAGKSTLVNILAGLVKKDSGELLLDGQTYEPDRAGDAFAAGVSFAAQELSTIGTLSVAENVSLRSLPNRMHVVDKRLLNNSARKMMDLVGLQDIAPDTPVERLSLAERQLIEIAKAMSGECRLLILDEPTAALASPQADRLHELLRQRAASGTSVVYISHRLEDVLKIADTVSVLRDGKLVMTAPSKTLVVDDLVDAMAGKIFQQQSTVAGNTPRALQLIRADAITTKGLPEPVSISAHGGEIVGIAGLAGAGRSELLHALFRLEPLTGGQVTRLVDGQEIRLRNSRHAVDAGVALLGEDRQAMGIFEGQSVLTNMMVPGSRESRSPLRLIDANKERAAAESLARKLDIRCRDIDQDITELSGGNQQKALIGRWLNCDSEVLLLDEPTRGVDVGTKNAIYKLLFELRDKGKCVLLASSEIEELLTVSNRIIVMSDRRLVHTFEQGDCSEAGILAAAFSQYTGRSFGNQHVS